MTLLPVLARELRVESRSAFTYWLRVLGGASLLAVGGLLFLNEGLANQAGGRVFCVLQLTLLVAIWVVVPLMCADCISREKREGTLGLLFLTPLRSFEVVLAKGLAHGLRAMALCVAALPVLVVPFLLGGVGWKEAMVAVMVVGSSLCLALGAGLLASAWHRSMTWAMGMALFWSGVLALGMFLVLGGLFVFTVLRFAPNPQVGRLWRAVLESAIALLFEPGEVIQWLSMNGLGTGIVPMSAVLTTLVLLSVIGLLVMLLLASVGVRRHAHERPRSVTREKLEKEFCTPAFGLKLFRRWMQRLLRRNPIGWLERRTWQSRLVMWSWLTALLLFYSLALPQAVMRSRDLDVLHVFLGWLLVGNVALSACGSLRRERESGVMELLLVSPLSAGQIITGRLRGLWGQFLPIGVLMLVLWVWMMNAFYGISMYQENVLEELAKVAFFSLSLLNLPVVGLYFSMRCRMLVAALFCTAVMGVLLPAVMAVLISYLVSDRHLLHDVWRMSFVALAGTGALSLVTRPLRELKSLSAVLAAGLFATCVGGIVLWSSGSDYRNQGELVSATLVFALVQVGMAVLLGVGLRQLLERRRFALPL